MPIRIPDNLPAKEILLEEKIFIMDDTRAVEQDIRPLKIAILNLMPIKETTEVQLLRLMGNSPLQIDITLLHMESHKSKNTTQNHLSSFYKVYNDIKKEKFDGVIITGAPIELYEFEEVTYWEELKKFMEWTKTNVTSTLHICWGAQAGLYYHYGIKKCKLDEKMFGVFKHKNAKSDTNIMRGFDDIFNVPHSRHTEVRIKDIENVKELELLSYSEEAGVYLVGSVDGKYIFVTGHSEYDNDTLEKEYKRDIEKGLDIKVPQHYFKDNDPNKLPIVSWRAHSNLLFVNWLNFYVYQKTPYNIDDIN